MQPSIDHVSHSSAS